MHFDAKVDVRQTPAGIGRLVTRRLDELTLHPSYVRHHLTVPASKLTILIGLGDCAFRDPLVITADGLIIDGYSRYELARLQARKTLHCIEYEITEQEALHWMLQMHRRSNGLNDFTRILLALELEPWLREKALLNQRAGGQNKGLSKLTEACRVRSELALAAGVCEGNVTMVKQLMARAHPDLFEALRTGEIRIHRAWKWSKQSTAKQIQALRFYRSKKGVHRDIRRLISSHKPRSTQIVFDLGRLIQLVSGLDPDDVASLSVLVVKAPGKLVYVTEELVQALDSQQELTLHAQ